MANTYTWTVTGMQNYPSYQSQTNVVFSVTYNVTGTDGTNTATITRSQNIPYVAGETFVPYASLTNAIVIGWVQAILGSFAIQSIESQVDGMLARMQLPASETSPLPWATTQGS
jgi:molecular chaperone DnaK (HSP70)